MSGMFSGGELGRLGCLPALLLIAAGVALTLGALGIIWLFQHAQVSFA